AASEEVTQPGGVKTLRPDVALEKIEVYPPGRVPPVPLQRGSRAEFSFGATDQIGIYQVAWDNQVQRYFAVNLLDPDESNIEPRQSVKIGTDEVRAGKTRGTPLE